MILLPEDDASIKTSHGSVQIVRSAKQIGAALWNGTFAADCLDSRYYSIIEETLRDRFDFRYAILTHAPSGPTAAQPFFFTEQPITGGLPAWFQAIAAHAPHFLSRSLSIRMAVVGCAAGDSRLACAEPWALEAMEEALTFYARETRARLLLFKDFPAHDRKLFDLLARRGYTRIPSMPYAKLDLDFASFDEYLQTKVGRGFRRDLRHKLIESEKPGRLNLEVVADATPYLDEIYPLYLQTHNRSPFRFEKLTREYFSRLGRDMPERTRFFLWRQEGRLLAFALCLVHNGTLHYLNVGMDYPLALERHLYYLVWRDLLSWAIDAKLKTLETGPLNYEVKFRLGLRLVPRDLYVRHVSPALNPCFAVALRFLQPTRYDRSLRKFPNAKEL